MNPLRAEQRSLLGDARGLSTAEYAILLVLVAAVALGVWVAFGGSLRCALLQAQAEFSRLDSAGKQQAQACAAGQSGRLAGGQGVPGEDEGASSTWGPGEIARRVGPGGSKTPPKPAPTPSEKMIQDVLKVMCPQDKAYLQELKRRGVTIKAYDRIYFDDPYYDGTKWTTKHFEAGGTTSGTKINMLRSPSATENAATIYHEGVHTGQPRGMAWRDKEYEAYIKEDQWRISHGLPPHTPSFRKKDAAGNEVTNDAAVRAFVDKEYPGVSSVPAGGGAPEEVLDQTPSGKVLVERADGSRYVRAPKKGDSYSGKQKTVPRGGIPIPIDKLQCP